MQQKRPAHQKEPEVRGYQGFLLYDGAAPQAPRQTRQLSVGSNSLINSVLLGQILWCLAFSEVKV